MRARWLVLVPAVVLLAACGAAPYSSTQGARIVRYTLRSRLMDRSLKQVLVVPAGQSAGRPLLVLLHGRSSGADQFLGDPMFTELRRLGRRAPVILNPYGHAPVLVDVGRTDGFRFADDQLANDLRAHGANVTFRFQPGGHSGWRNRMDQYLRFYSDALAGCG